MTLKSVAELREFSSSPTFLTCAAMGVEPPPALPLQASRQFCLVIHNLPEALAYASVLDYLHLIRSTFCAA